jgi:hypothetical protein
VRRCARHELLLLLRLQERELRQDVLDLGCHLDCFCR